MKNINLRWAARWLYANNQFVIILKASLSQPVIFPTSCRKISCTPGVSTRDLDDFAIVIGIQTQVRGLNRFFDRLERGRVEGGAHTRREGAVKA